MKPSAVDPGSTCPATTKSPDTGSRHLRPVAVALTLRHVYAKCKKHSRDDERWCFLKRVGEKLGCERGYVVLPVMPVLCLHVNTSYALLSLIMRERTFYLNTAVRHVTLCPPAFQSYF
jgi:hypothetical protein